MIIGNDLLDKWNANINYKERILELEKNNNEIIDIPVWYIKQVEESEESDYEKKEVIKENEFQKDNESSSEESSSDDSEISSENKD
ncbi:hypothetical protein RhiirA4_484181 [Rhizophagus irregularis]|uniref:Uncharacterized protein n=1 Tax=Rhizophagus irregularis TaxID=588596 RepID=A0A2I1HNJ6_9GLOM|nr:hypothetical protein RhiirA4_484181 [Rhizophagus irregularis]